MTTWIEPKTNWHGEYDKNNNYQGDRFNLSDYNRLNNNLKVLNELAVKVYPDFTIKDNVPKTISDYIYADEINCIEENLEKINSLTFNAIIGDRKTYYPNGYFIDFKELNRIEKAMLLMHDYLINQLSGLRQFAWNFGDGGGEL